MPTSSVPQFGQGQLTAPSALHELAFVVAKPIEQVRGTSRTTRPRTPRCPSCGLRIVTEIRFRVGCEGHLAVIVMKLLARPNMLKAILRVNHPVTTADAYPRMEASDRHHVHAYLSVFSPRGHPQRLTGTQIFGSSASAARRHASPSLRRSARVAQIPLDEMHPTNRSSGSFSIRPS